MSQTKPITKAAIIGCNWGMVHLAALQQSGLELSALVDVDLPRAQSLAQQLNIAHACQSLTQVPEVDLVIIATPAISHMQVIEHFSQQAIICEKPLLGLSANQLPANWPKRLWVNYAFNQLESAQLINQLIQPTQGPVRVQLSSQVNLPLKFSLEQWFLETASHPLSWLLHLLGEPRQLSKQTSEQELKLELACGEHRININFTLGGAAGIYHQVQVQQGQKNIQLKGHYIPGQAWRFMPVLLNGEPQNHGEYHESDCWLQANQRSTSLIIKHLQGQLSEAELLAQGGFNPTKALWLEQSLLGEKFNSAS